MQDLAPVEVAFTAADGTHLVGRRMGRGKPVVLIHGSGGGLNSFDPVAPLLADEFELWVYARRGYAPSDGCSRAKTFHDDVADLTSVLAATGGRAHVVGVSYGATVALHAAQRDSAMIRSVALFEPPLYSAGSALAPVLARYRRLVAAGDLPAASRLFAEKVSHVPAVILDALAQVPDARRNAEQEAAEAAEAVACLHDLEAMATDEPDVGRWVDVRLPVLLIQGADTWAPMPTTMDTLAEALPQVTRRRLAGQMHFATHTAPELFADTLSQFLRAALDQR
jgi:pimeloyl-ACP methyl ester carboxylesterase